MAVNFLKKGKAAHEAVAQADLETEQKKLSASVFRFYLPEDKESQITFLDGDLDDDGLIDTCTMWEHQLKLNGSWKNWFVCTRDNEPCPICEGGNGSSLVALFSVIDHSEWKDSNDIVHKNERKLFVAKRDTLKLLQKIATKRGGLAGARFDVSRVSGKDANVGGAFDFVDKTPLGNIAAMHSIKPDQAIPFDYGEVIHYRTAAELIKLGLGGSGVQSDTLGADDNAAVKQAGAVDYNSQL